MGRPEFRADRSLTLRRTLGFLRPAAGRLTITTLLGAGAAGSGVALLATSGWLISRAAQHPSVVDLGIAIVGVRFFAISRGLLRYSERVFGHDTALRVLADLRVRVYERLEALAPTGLAAFRRGDLLARVVQDVDAVQDLMLRVVLPYAVAILVGVPTVAVIWYVLPPAGLILAVGLVAGIFVVPLWSRALARRREARLAVARGELSARIVDVLEGAADLVAFGALDDHLSRVSQADAEITRTSSATAQTAGIGSALITSLSGLVVWGILLVGVGAVHAGRVQGPLLAVLVLTPLALFETVTGLPAAAQHLVRVRQSADRVGEVMDTRPPVTDPEAPVSLDSSGPPTLRVRGLRARYGSRSEWALDGVDLDLPPGRRVGIVGASGAGKSTLAAVLLRFLPYESGTVSLQGVELNAVTGDDVRRIVGLAAQDSHVFDTTIRENLMLAKRDATEAEIRAALVRARLLEWVDELPAGLDTEVGQHGARMSGGQRQRLGIARALLARFPVLILDEPGEHLDTATADAITADLLDVTQGHSTLLISHRLAGMDELDEIVVLSAGRVVERGTHAELLDLNGAYAREWRRERRAGAGLELVR